MISAQRISFIFFISFFLFSDRNGLTPQNSSKREAVGWGKREPPEKEIAPLSPISKKQIGCPGPSPAFPMKISIPGKERENSFFGSIEGEPYFSGRRSGIPKKRNRLPSYRERRDRGLVEVQSNRPIGQRQAMTSERTGIASKESRSIGRLSSISMKRIHIAHSIIPLTKKMIRNQIQKLGENNELLKMA